MSTELVGIICFAAFVVLAVLGFPILYTMLLVGMVGYTLIDGWGVMSEMLGIICFKGIHSFGLTVIPLFILLGNLATHSGIAGDLYTAARLWLSRLNGGLAHATIAAGAVFAAASGAASASAAVFTRLALPEMKRTGYDMTLSTGAVAAAGPLAAMIPPSVLMIVYSMLSEASLGHLFIAGVVPGIMTAVLLMGMIWIRCRLNPSLAPATGSISWKLRFKSLSTVWPMIIIVLSVLGSIYVGIATPTEAASLGAFSTLVMGVVMRRLNWRNIYDSLLDSALITGIIMAIVMAARVFTHAITISGLTTMIINTLASLDITPLIVLIVLMGVYIILGCLIPAIPLLFLTMPVVVPIVHLLGFDPVWFGILMVCVLELGAITPPMGISLFAVKGALPQNIDVSIAQIAKGAVPFMFGYLVALAILIAFPSISLFLPSLMM